MCRLVKDAGASGKGLVQVLLAATFFAVTVILLLKLDIEDTGTQIHLSSVLTLQSIMPYPPPSTW